MAIYLQNEVIGRKCKRRGRVGKLSKASDRPEQTELVAEEGDDSGEEGEGAPTAGGKSDETKKIVSQSVIKNTINALVDLWARQQSINNGTIPNPRSNYEVKKIINTLSRQEADRKRSTNYNRLDGEFVWSASEIQAVLDW